MGKSVPASMKTRKRIEELMDGTSRASDAKSDFVKLATRLLLEEAAEAEARCAGPGVLPSRPRSRAPQRLSAVAIEECRGGDRVCGPAGAGVEQLVFFARALAGREVTAVECRELDAARVR